MPLGRFTFLLSLALVGCNAASLSDPAPGNETHLDYGSIAVDDRSETSFVLRDKTSDEGVVTASTLFAVDPNAGAVTSVADLTGRVDPRVLFPASGVLVMSERAGHDILDLFDATTFARLGSSQADVRYSGVRMSPSRATLAVADATTEHGAISLVDASTLETRAIPHGGTFLEAQWLNTSDRLASIVFYDDGSPTAHARLLVWSVPELVAQGFPTDATGAWTNAQVDVDLSGYSSDDGFSFDWIGVSPDDHWIVFPVRALDKSGEDSYTLVVLDATSGEVRTVPRAKGPVGFTPDSATIVSYDTASDGSAELLLIDAKTLAADPVPLPISGAIRYFVSHDGNVIVVGSSAGAQRIVLYDVADDHQTTMDGPAIALTEFVSRPSKAELWAVDGGALYRLDLNAASIDAVSLAFSPSHLNILPKRDRLVLDAATPDLFFVDPSKEKTDLDAPLPE